MQSTVRNQLAARGYAKPVQIARTDHLKREGDLEMIGGKLLPVVVDDQREREWVG